MLTDVKLINNGLAIISGSRIKRIDPPITPLEGFMESGYRQWRNSEIAKRRWVFALVEGYKLTLVEELANSERPYKFPLPNDCIRPFRTKYSDWVQRGRYVYSADPELTLDYVADVPESEFDVWFNDVLSARIGYESAEYVTQSNTKYEKAKAAYREALIDASKNNAFIIGPEDIQEDDADFSWVSVRHG